MNIKLNVPGKPFTGQVITFTAPCNCSEVVDGLMIDDELYLLYDVAGHCLTGRNAWSKGSQVSVVLDCENNVAFMQSSNTVRVKLWQNANVNNAFDAQTISLDLSGYDGVEVVFCADPSSKVYGNSGFCPKGLNCFMTYTNSTNGYRLHRWFTANQNGIVFEQGANTGTTEANKACVPYIIYGIKGVG